MNNGERTKNKLSIYLIKEGKIDPEKIIKIEKANGGTVAITDSIMVYIRKNTGYTPKWVNDFFVGFLDETQLMGSTVGCAALVRVYLNKGKTEERFFVLSFGYGYLLINDEAIKRRFGLKCVLNHVSANSIRQLRTTSVSGNAKKNSEQMPKQSSIAEFSINVEQDLLNGVTAVGEKDSLLPGSITGADSLSVTAPINIKSIEQYLLDIYGLYKKDVYKENFPWVDQIAPVKDKTLIAKLEEEAIRLLTSGDPTLWFAVPENIKWEEVAGFRYSKRQDLADDILTDDVLKVFNNDLSDFSKLKSKRVYAVDSKTEEDSQSWSLNRCLYGEFSFESNQYCVSDGMWYQISKDFAKEISDDYTSSNLCDLNFPDYVNMKDETAYNKALSDSNQDFLSMDRKNIVYGGGRSQIELCDVLTKDNQFIHVKRYSGSSVMSHLFNQGLVSMELVKRDRDFLDKANKKIAEINKSQDFQLSHLDRAEVVYGIITKEKVEIPNLPFFSKVAFHYIKQRFQVMGVKVSLKAIYDPSKDQRVKN